MNPERSIQAGFGAHASEWSKRARFVYSFLRRRMVHVNLQILYSCNFRCTICDFWHLPWTALPKMSLDQVERLSRKLAGIGPQIISIGGGEPLLHEDVVGIVEVLGRDHFPVMISNGWSMTPALARALFRAGVYEVSISLDYADPQRHDRQRGAPGAFGRAVEALRMLQAGRVRPWQRVHMISVVMHDNLEEIEKLIRLARKLGVTYVVTLYSPVRGRRSREYLEQDIGGHLIGLKKKYPEFVSMGGYLEKFSIAAQSNGVAPCYAGLNLMNIDSGGNVTACIDDTGRPAGNIFSDSWEHISASLRQARARAGCHRCWTSCRGSIESMMYGNSRLRDLVDYYRMTCNVPLA